MIDDSELVPGPLEYYPRYSFSTVQTNNEVLDTIITSLLLTFILVNFNATIHKLVTVTHRDYLNYNSYIRAYIFAASDDITQIISWIRGRNSFLPEHMEGVQSNEKRILRSRLICPLFARAIVFFAAILSIALALPSDKVFSECSGGDFETVIKQLNQDENLNGYRANSLCSLVDLKPRRGTTPTTINLCAQEITDELTEDPIQEQSFDNWCSFKFDPEEGVATVLFGSSGKTRGIRFYVEWTPSKNKKLRSILQTQDQGILDASSQRENLRRAIKDLECDLADEDSGNTDTGTYEITCDVDAFDVEKAADNAERVFRSALRFHRTDDIQERLDIPVDGSDPKRIKECPFIITVSRPIINILPLAVTVVLSFTINMAVGFTVSERGSVDDITYHVIKEALGLDVTCNPLQEPKSQRGSGASLPLIKLKKFWCNDGVSAHIGFLRAPEDREVEDMEEGRQLGQCFHPYRGLALDSPANLTG